MVKDYYKILELPPQASLREVKKNFRRLALRYHPDTNPGNPYAGAWYREIQEAYETLADDTLRDAYHQKRWLLKSQGKAFAPIMALTPPFILLQSQELLAQVREMDHFRMSHEALQQQVALVLSDENMNTLASFNDVKINRQVAEAVILSTAPLDYPFLPPLLQRLEKALVADPVAFQRLSGYLQKRRRQYVWEKYQALVYLLLTILLCAIIYWMGSK